MIPVVVHMWMEFDSERSNFLFYITRNKKKTWKTLKFKTTSDSLPYHTLSAVCWTTQGETRKTGSGRSQHSDAHRQQSSRGTACTAARIHRPSASPSQRSLHLRPRTLSHGVTISQLEHKSKVILQTSLSVFRKSPAFVTATMQ